VREARSTSGQPLPSSKTPADERHSAVSAAKLVNASKKLVARVWSAAS
jgi:hypothetical protein